jgi:hypothetical protein
LKFGEKEEELVVAVRLFEEEVSVFVSGRRRFG